jgi:hypothetical protein
MTTTPHTADHLPRRSLLQWSAAALLGALGGPLSANPATARPVIEVWKTPTCGCCKDWIRHLESEGFAVKFHDLPHARKDEQRRRLGLADKYGSCHTGLVGGYVLEGHVPAREIHRLLKEKPKALGLAVPGMPVGSPGMDGPEYGGHKDPYEVLLVQRDGSARVYQAYR